MKILVDTCIWSLALRRNSEAAVHIAELQNLILDNRVQMIGPVRQELLSGIRQEAQFKKLEKRLRSFPDLPIATTEHVLAAKFYNLCRSKGIQGSNTDFLICALSVQHKMPIYTTDKDFTHFAKFLPIAVHQTKT